MKPKTRPSQSKRAPRSTQKALRPAKAKRSRPKANRPARRHLPAQKKSKSKKPLAGYRYLEHTGDIMIGSWGPDFPAALVQAARAMFAVMGPAQPKLYFEVDESALNADELVVYFLSKVLGESEAREMVPCQVEVVQFSSGPAWRMKARIWGEERRPRDAIKAVTFHELKVDQTIRGCKIQVLLDV